MTLTITAIRLYMSPNKVRCAVKRNSEQMILNQKKSIKITDAITAAKLNMILNFRRNEPSRRFQSNENQTVKRSRIGAERG
jgi:hypothetical protein